ncbi:MAG: GNAT family N-acetyltransferase, partial [Nitrososphaerales archaeon]
GVDRDMLLCAKLGGKVVGQVFTLPRRVKLRDNTFRVGAVAFMAVHPDFRRRGIARSLMEKVVKTAEEKGFDALTLFTHPAPLSHAYPLYERLGFKTFYSTNPQMKVLDPWFLAKAIGRPYLALLMWLKARVKDITLPEGFMIRRYEQKDRPRCVALVKEHVEQFDYVELVSEDFWVWWQESMPEAANPKTLVLERNGELIGTIACYTSAGKAKGKRGEIEFQMGGIGNLFYKRGYEQQVQSLIGRVLKELKRLGAPVATNMMSPNVFQPTDFLRRVWGKHGFIKNKDIEQIFMYKSLNSEFDGLEALKTFYIQPF